MKPRNSKTVPPTLINDDANAEKISRHGDKNTYTHGGAKTFWEAI